MCKFWIKTSEGLFEVTCNMKLKCGGVEGGWMQLQVVDVDMNRDDSCPRIWQNATTPKKLCTGSIAECSPAQFNLMCRELNINMFVDKLKLIKKGHPMHTNHNYNPLMVHMSMVFPSL